MDTEPTKLGEKTGTADGNSEVKEKRLKNSGEDLSSKEFQGIVGKLHEAQNLLQQVNECMQMLKKTYHEVIQTYHQNMLGFSLDSFFFKYKLLEMETDHYSKTLQLIHNRMYGDYYKLYHILFAFFMRHQPSQPLNHLRKYTPIPKPPSEGNHAPYHDLETFQDFTIEEIHVLHIDIVNMCVAFTKLENTSVEAKEQLSIFLNYVSFFHHTQIDLLTQLIQKITVFYNEWMSNDYFHYIQTFLQKHDLSMRNKDKKPTLQKSREQILVFSRNGSPLISRDVSPIHSRNGTPLISRNGTPFVSRHGTRHSSPLGTRNTTWGISYEHCCKEDSVPLYSIYDTSQNTIPPHSNPLQH